MKQVKTKIKLLSPVLQKTEILKYKFFSIIVLVLLLTLPQLVLATTVNTLNSSGAWETDVNWSLGHRPTNSEDAVIPANISVNINSAAICASLTIGDGNFSSAVTINGSNSLTTTLAGGGTGDLSFNTTNNSNSYSLSAGAGSIVIAGTVLSGGNNGGSITVSTGSISFINAAGMTWGTAINLTVSGAGSASFTGPLNLSTSSAGSTTFLLTSTGNFTFNGLVTQSDATYTLSNTTTAGTINFNGGYNFSAGAFTTLSGETINFAGNLTVTDTPINFASGSNTVFTGSATITPLATVAFGNFRINSGVTVTAAGDLSVIGNWTNNGGTFTPGINTVTFNGTAAQAINGTSPSQSFYNITLGLTAGQALSVSGSTTTLTTQNFTQTTGDFSAGTATSVNINGNLTIASGTYTPGTTTNITGDFSNAGTYTAAATKTIAFVGASNSTVTGLGTYTIFNFTLNKSSKTTIVDLQSANFITGINTGNVYNFTFTQGTLKYNNSATLTDCHNNGVTTALTIPFNVVIESNAGTMNLCKSGTMTGTASNVVLSGALYINGGSVLVLRSTTTVDFQYRVNGGTPQLYITSGNLSLGGGFNYNPTTAVDYIDFSMTGGTVNTGTTPTNLATFALGNYTGGKTNMTGGIIYLEDATTGNYPDIDLGGSNVSPYNVSGGTVQFGTAGTAGSTIFAFQAYSSTNYPHFLLASGIAKQVVVFNNSDYKVLSLTISSGMTFDNRDYLTSTDNHRMTIMSNNGSSSFSNSGTFTPRTGTIEFTGTANQIINGSNATLTLYNVIINNSGGAGTSIAGSITTFNTQNFTETAGNFNPGTAATMTITGNTTLTSGTFTAPTTLNVKGNWTNNGGTFSPGTNTVNFTGTATQSITGTSSSETFYNVVLAKTAGQVLNTAGSISSITTNNLTMTTGNFTAPATLNINATSNSLLTLTAGTFTAGTTININGNWTNNGGTFTPGTGTVNFTGTGTQNINGTATAQTFYNLVVAKTSGQLLTPNGSTTTLTTQDFTATSGNFTAPATMNINGNYTLMDGTYTAGSNTNVKGDWSHSSSGTALFIPGINSVTFNGTGAQSIKGTATSETFYNVIVNKTAGTLLNTSGNITSITTNNFTNTLGNFTAPATLNITSTSTSALTMTTGTFTAGATININGNWTNNGGTFTPSTNTVNFTGTAAQSINGTTAAQNFYNVVVLKTAGQLLNTGGSVTSITTNNLTVTSGNFTAPATLNINSTTASNLTLTAGTFTAGTTVNITGDWINNGGTFTPGTNTINFVGTGSQSIRGTAASQTFYHVVVNKTAGQLLNTAGSTTTLTTQNLTNTQGNFTAPATLNINGNYTLTDGTFTAGTTINSKGNWTHASIGSAVFSPGTNTVNFSGTGAQTINGTATSETFYNVIIAKTAGQLLNTGGSIITITTNNLTETTGNFTAPTTLNINATSTASLLLTAGTFTAGTTVNINGDWTNNGGTFTPSTSTVNFTGTGAQSIKGTAVAQTFYHVNVAKTAGQLLNTSGSTVTLTTQNLSQTTGNFTAPSTLNINGNLTIADGTFTAGTTINAKGDWVHNSGVSALFTPGLNTVNFTGTGTQQLKGTAISETFYNVVINKTAASLLNSSGSIATMTVNNLTNTQGDFTAPATLTINGNYILTNGTFTAGANINIKGNWTHATLASAIFSSGTGIVSFIGTGAQTINGTKTSETFSTLEINKTIGTTLNTGGSVVTINTLNLIQTQGNFTAPATFTANGDLTLTTGTFTAGATMNIKGNWNNNGGTFTPGTNTVNFNGSANAQTIGGSSATTFYNINTNNTYTTSPQFTIGINTTISNQFTMTAGEINLSTNTLTLGTSAAAPGSLVCTPSSSNFMGGGNFKRWFNTTTIAAGNVRGLFPMGTISGDYYAPMYLSTPVSAPTTGGTITASFTDASTKTDVNITDGASTIERRNDANWTMVTANGLAGGTYNLVAERTFCAICVGDVNDLRLMLANSVVGTAGTNGGTTTQPQVSRTGLTLAQVANSFFIGSVSFVNSPLPIELISFDAQLKNDKVKINWVTASESNNAWFVIEKSIDGLNYELLEKIKGAGNSSSVNSYTASDENPSIGRSAYRLKQIDFDGKINLFAPVWIFNNRINTNQITLFPNPNDGTGINVTIYSDRIQMMNITIYDVVGKLVLSENVKLIPDQNVITVNPPEKLKPGIYFLTADLDSKQFNSRLLIK